MSDSEFPLSLLHCGTATAWSGGNRRGERLVLLAPEAMRLDLDHAIQDLARGRVLVAPGDGSLFADRACRWFRLGGRLAERLGAETRVIDRDCRALLGPLHHDACRLDPVDRLGIAGTAIAWQVLDRLLALGGVPDLREVVMQNLLHSLRTKPDGPVPLEWLAKRAGVSVATVRRWIRERYGCGTTRLAQHFAALKTRE